MSSKRIRFMKNTTALYGGCWILDARCWIKPKLIEYLESRIALTTPWDEIGDAQL